MKTDISPTALSVNDGRDRVGFIQPIGGNWLCTDPTGKPVGTFPTQQEAVRALRPAPPQASN
jgi:hypothetical protein